jgi:hypothetical protein
VSIFWARGNGGESDTKKIAKRNNISFGDPTNVGTSGISPARHKKDAGQQYTD